MTPGQTDPLLARLEQENKRLGRAVEELSILNEVASAVTSTSSLDAIVDLIVEKCVKHLAVEQGAVLLLDRQEPSAPLRTLVRRVDSEFGSIPYRLGDQLTGWMLKHQAPLLINDLAGDGRFRSGDSDKPFHSLMCVPLSLKRQLIGVLTVFNKRAAEGFTESDQRLLSIIAAQSAQVIENARLYEEEQALREMRRDLEVARNIQMKLLPKSAPEIAGFDIAGKSVPAQNVGGDYFDFLPAGEQRFAICLGDVVGKGMPAALLMANVQATIRGQNLLQPSAGECLGRSNRLLYESTDSDKFVTLFYGILDPSRRQLHYSNAGHNPPMLISANARLQRLTTGGPVLGMLPEFAFEEATVSLDPGDSLVIFSDGFSEAMDSQLEEFGEEQLLELARRHREATAAGVIDAVSDAVSRHAGEAPQNDDMTMVVVQALRSE